MPAKTVLITGCSTGIGHDLARRLARAGYAVIATARRPETLADLPVALRLPLDVTDAASVASATEEVVRRFGRVDVLINNAGYAVRGVLEEVSDEQVQQMFDVNVHGVLRMIRAVVPQMRRQAAGRIINISSIASRVVLPVNGTYAATKCALEALSDAARLELAPFGIQVVLIEPGSIRTHFLATAQAHAPEILSNPASPYHALYQHYRQFEATMRRQEVGPEVVSRVVQQALKAPRPRARYLVAVPFSGRLVLHAWPLLGDPLRDVVVRRMFKMPGRIGRTT
jgi:NAD(P)-dependent dehydrogenase (short-subunit alcohol dehydrogenase family)